MATANTIPAARAANRIHEATHCYPTTNLGGAGYFGRGLRHIVSPSDESALLFAQANDAPDLPLHQLQRRRSRGAWVSCGTNPPLRPASDYAEPCEDNSGDPEHDAFYFTLESTTPGSPFRFGGYLTAESFDWLAGRLGTPKLSEVRRG